jgi:iron complex outermembrane receptor protein
VGRNSTGGAVLYTSRQPTDTYSSYLNLTAGDYGRAEAQGAINIPLTDTLFFRAAVSLADNRGYIANYFYDPASGTRNNQPAMGSDKIAGKFSLKWAPGDDFSILLRADISAEHDTGSSYHDLGYFAGSGVYHGKIAICNIPGTCTGFTDLLGHVVAPYYTNYLTGTAINPNPASYNAELNSVAREQKYGFWSTEQSVNNADIGHYRTLSAEVNKSLDGIDVKWLSAYRQFDNHGASTSRGLSYDTTIYDYSIPNYQSWQSELTLNGTALSGDLKWTTGLFYFREDSPDDGGLFYLYLPSAVTPQPVTGKQIVLQDGTGNSQRNASYAAYAQATYTIRPDTRLTAGLRYTYDERHAYLATASDNFPANPTTAPLPPYGIYDSSPYTLNGISYAGQTHLCTLTNTSGHPLPAAACNATADASFHKPTYTLALDHDLWDGTMVYATMRSGYRSGAINSAAIQPAALVAKPEELTDYELGVKSDISLFGVPVRANIDAYFSDYHDIQVLEALPNVTAAPGPGGVPCTQALFNAGQCPNATTDNVTLNAKTAHIHGLEWDVQVLPTDWLTLAASGSYLDARYTDFTYTPPPGYLLPTGGTNLSGTPFPLPAWQLNETATFATGLKSLFGLPVDDFTFTAHYYWQSRFLADMTGFDPSQRTGSYGLLDLRASVTNIAGRNLDVTLFVSNVLDTPVCAPEYDGVLSSAPQGSFGVPGAGGVTQCVPLAPREAGLRLGYKF